MAMADTMRVVIMEEENNITDERKPQLSCESFELTVPFLPLRSAGRLGAKSVARMFRGIKGR